MKNSFDARAFRHERHKHPELSGEERVTAQKVTEVLEGFNPDEIVNGLGGHGIAAFFRSGKPGPAVMLRCDLDALPIEDSIDAPYKSIYPGVGHKCGHDGHMTIMLLVAEYLSQNRPVKGSVCLLFQPSEEDAAGAHAVLQDDRFKKLRFDFSFALHNLPGKPIGTVVVREGVMNAASDGLIIQLKGLHSHAGEPEKGINPVFGLSRMVMETRKILEEVDFEDKVWSTVIHARVGERAFGTSPGEGVLMLTLRSYLDKDLDLLKKETEKRVKKIAGEQKLKTSFEYTDLFPSCVNDGEAVAIVRRAAEKAGLPHEDREEPYRVSEDYAWFTKEYPSALCWVGSGEDQPNLHHPAYDFPDHLLLPARELFVRILSEAGILREKQTTDLNTKKHE